LEVLLQHLIIISPTASKFSFHLHKTYDLAIAITISTLARASARSSHCLEVTSLMSSLSLCIRN
jgi:hypothetical protein